MTTTKTARTDFSTRLYDTLAKAQVSKDLILSPFSIQVALAMCAAGAKGETRRVLAELIGAAEEVAEQDRQYATWLKLIHDACGPNLQLATANALWVQQGQRLDSEYQKAVADYYGGACKELEFQKLPDQAARTINAWVEKKTAGKIKELIRRDAITGDTRLILTNAIYFKGKWASEFDTSHTWDEDWQGPSGGRKTPMMHQRGTFLYCEETNYQALDLAYQGERVSLLVVLPRKADGLAALEGQLASGNVYDKVTTELAREDAMVSLPRFQMEAEFQLKPALSELGAAIAFSDIADFGGIGASPLKISEVIHKAFVEVNEEGTEAAAATGVVMSKGGAMRTEPKNFVADHPFLFFIRDRKTNGVLFQGRVVDPKG